MKSQPAGCFFPWFHGARNNPKKWMSFRQSDSLEFGEEFRIPRVDFGLEMRPFILQLPQSEGEAPSIAPPAYFRAREAIAAPDGLRVYMSQIFGNASGRRFRSAKSFELRMLPVSARPAAEHRLGKQTLAPQRHQPLAIEVFWMQAPESHDMSLQLTPWRSNPKITARCRRDRSVRT